MKSTLIRFLLPVISLGLGLGLYAQSNPIPIEYLRPMKNNFSIGVRVIGGAKVTFSGDLGATNGPATREMLAFVNGVRTYDNGTISQDSATYTGPNNDRTAYVAGGAGMFTASEGMPTDLQNAGFVASPGFYYTYTDANGISTVTGKYALYQEGKTRYWAFAGEEGQIINGGSQVAMSMYSSEGAGDTVTADAGASPGVEFQFGRILQRFKKFEWGINFSFGVAEFNAKTNQQAKVKLSRIQDIYDVYVAGANGYEPGVLPTGTVSGPTYDTTGDSGIANSETTAMLSQDPSHQGTLEELAELGGVDGFWQVKGVYYIFRLGPMIRVPISRNFSITAGAGYLGTYIGSKMRINEMLVLPDSPGFDPLVTYPISGYTSGSGVSKNNQCFRSGFYADANLEWWLSTRTGFFAGASYESMGSYNQEVLGRKASVKMDNGVGFRFGLITRF